MPLFVDPWDRILADPEFQAMSFDTKEQVANNFFDQELKTDPEYGKLSVDVQGATRANFMATLGTRPDAGDPSDIGGFRNFTNGFYNSGVNTIADYYALFGAFESSQSVQEHLLPVSDGSVGSFLGGAAGGVAPSALALLGGPITVGAVLAHYALQSSGSARRYVNTYRQEHGEEAVDPVNELAVTIGAGAIGMGAEALGIGKVLKPAMRGVTPSILRKIGFDVIGNRLGMAARTTAQMVLGEGTEEAAQEAATNSLYALFVNPEQALTEGVGTAFLAGAVGGGMLLPVKYMPKYMKARSVFKDAAKELDKSSTRAAGRAIIEESMRNFQATGDPAYIENAQQYLNWHKIYGTLAGVDPEGRDVLAADSQKILLLPEGRRQPVLALPPADPEAVEAAQTLALPTPAAQNIGETPPRATRENPTRTEADSGPPITPAAPVYMSPGGEAGQFEANEAIDAATDAANVAGERLEQQIARGREPRKTLDDYDTAVAELHTQWSLANPGDTTGDGLLYYLAQRARGRNIRPRRFSTEAEKEQRKRTREEIGAFREGVRAMESELLPVNQRGKRRQSLYGKTAIDRFTETELAGYQAYLEALQKRRVREETRKATEDRPTVRRVDPGVSGEDLAIAEQAEISPQEARDRRLNLNRDVIEANETEGAAEPVRNIEATYEESQEALEAFAKEAGKDPEDLRLADFDSGRTFRLDEEPAQDVELDDERFEYQRKYRDDVPFSVAGMSSQTAAEVMARAPTVRQQQRLTNLLVTNGFFTRVHWTGGQILTENGSSANAAINPETGEVFFSRDVEFGTIGHEATHRLIELMGRGDPLIIQGLETFGGEEELSDAVGEFFEGRQMKPSRLQQIADWIRQVWAKAKQQFGLDLTTQEVLLALNTRLAKQAEPGLFIEPAAYEAFMTDVWFNGTTETPESRKSGTYEYQEKAAPTPRIRVTYTEEELQELNEKFSGEYTEAELEEEALTHEQLRAGALEILLKPKTLARIESEFGRGGGKISLSGQLALRIKASLQFRKLHQQLAAVRQSPEPGMDLVEQKIKEKMDRELLRQKDLSRYAGRTLEARKSASDPYVVIEAVNALERDLLPAEKTRIEEMMRDGGINDPIQVQDILNGFESPKKSDYFWELVMNGWLSGLPTHLVNAGNNAIWLGTQVPDRVLQSGVDATLSSQFMQWIFPSLRGRERTVFIEEVVPFMTGLAAGRETAKRTGVVGKVLKGEMMPDVASKFAIDFGSARKAFARSGSPVLRAAAPYISFPGNALFASDVYFRTLAFDAQLHALAYRESRKTGKAMKDIIAKPPKKTVEQCRDFASMATFNDRPGATARWIIQKRDALPFQMGRLVIPFVNTLTNIFKRGVELTPGLGALANVQRARALDVQLIARQLEGTVLAAILMSMFDHDEITGPVPESPTERAAFYKAGKIPYAIRMPDWLPGMGGTWLSYSRVEPLNTAISNIATAWQALADPQVEEDENAAVAIFSNLANNVWENLINSTYAENIERLVKPNIGEGIVRTIERLPAAMVPYSGFWRSINRAHEALLDDDEPLGVPVRERVGWTSELARVIPFNAAIFDEDFMGRQRVDAFGEAIEIPGGTFRQWLPIKWSTPDLDEVEMEMARLDAMPGLPQRKFTIRGEELEMPAEMFYRYAMAYGSATKKALAAVVRSPGYQRLSDEAKVKAIDRASRRIHSRIRERGRRELRASLR